jgi:hypothetical protein
MHRATHMHTHTHSNTHTHTHTHTHYQRISLRTIDVSRSPICCNRWASFVSALAGALRSGAPPPFDQAAFNAEVVRRELQWIANASINSSSVGVAPIGDTIAVATVLLDKWDSKMGRSLD